MPLTPIKSTNAHEMMTILPNFVNLSLPYKSIRYFQEIFDRKALIFSNNLKRLFYFVLLLEPLLANSETVPTITTPHRYM